MASSKKRRPFTPLTAEALIQIARDRGIDVVAWEYTFVLVWLNERHPEVLEELKKDMEETWKMGQKNAKAT